MLPYVTFSTGKCCVRIYPCGDRDGASLATVLSVQCELPAWPTEKIVDLADLLPPSLERTVGYHSPTAIPTLNYCQQLSAQQHTELLARFAARVALIVASCGTEDFVRVNDLSLRICNEKILKQLRLLCTATPDKLLQILSEDWQGLTDEQEETTKENSNLPEV